MRCVEISEFGGPEVLKIVERSRPEIASNELLIQVKAAGLNRADILQRKGHYPPPKGESDLPGLEVAGVVEAVGDGVDGWSVGDNVCALAAGGGYAEYVNVPAGQCLRMPDTLDYIQAACLPEALFTVWMSIFDIGRLTAGDRVLIHGGSSGIGVLAIQMARVWGAEVYVTAGTEQKCQACEQLGATLAINYKTEDFEEKLLAATNGKGVDVILDMVGGEYVSKNLAVAALDGRIVNIALQGGSAAKINMVPMLVKRLTLSATTLRSRSIREKSMLAQATLENMLPHVEAGAIKPVVDNVYLLEDAGKAHERMDSGEHIGKIILNVNDEAE